MPPALGEGDHMILRQPLAGLAAIRTSATIDGLECPPLGGGQRRICAHDLGPAAVHFADVLDRVLTVALSRQWTHVIPVSLPVGPLPGDHFGAVFLAATTCSKRIPSFQVSLILVLIIVRPLLGENFRGLLLVTLGVVELPACLATRFTRLLCLVLPAKLSLGLDRCTADALLHPWRDARIVEGQQAELSTSSGRPSLRACADTRNDLFTRLQILAAISLLVGLGMELASLPLACGDLLTPGGIGEPPLLGRLADVRLMRGIVGGCALLNGFCMSLVIPLIGLALRDHDNLQFGCGARNPARGELAPRVPSVS